MDHKQEVGSYTAKGGFENEADIVLKFNNFENDIEAQLWLRIMGYDHKKIQNLTASKIPPRIKYLSQLSNNIGLSAPFHIPFEHRVLGLAQHFEFFLHR